MAKRSLKVYQAKRDFEKSPEPTGVAKKKVSRTRDAKLKSSSKLKSSTNARRFCVQKHLASHLHYDFRLEHRGVLLSWAVPKGPSVNPAEKRLAMMTEDHPFDYGDFEGVISEGYGAGIVMLWDEGTWRLEGDGADDREAASDAAIERGLQKGEIKFSLDGVKLKGSWVLVRTRGQDSRSWLMIKHRDKWSGELDIAKAAPKSVKSFGDFADILAAENPRIWLSDREAGKSGLFKDGVFNPPAKGGEAGKMYHEIVRKALAIAGKRKSKTKTVGQSPKQMSATVHRR